MIENGKTRKNAGRVQKKIVYAPLYHIYFRAFSTKELDIFIEKCYTKNNGVKRFL